jgi:hypothetical protein
VGADRYWESVFSAPAALQELHAQAQQLRAELATVTAERDKLQEYISRAPSGNEQRLIREAEGALTLEEARHADTCAALKYTAEKWATEQRAHAETKAALEEARQGERDAVEHASLSDVHHRELAAARTATAELNQLRRAWALRELRRVQVICGEVSLSGDATMALIPDGVLALIRSGAGKPIGECALCLERWPLRRQLDGRHYMFTNAMDRVCAPGWGCSEKGASDGG